MNLGVLANILLVALGSVSSATSASEVDLPENFRMISEEPVHFVERDIIERRRHVLRVNASVSKPEIRVVLGEPDRLHTFAAVISRRLPGDLKRIYGDDHECGEFFHFE